MKLDEWDWQKNIFLMKLRLKKTVQRRRIFKKTVWFIVIHSSKKSFPDGLDSRSLFCYWSKTIFQIRLILKKFFFSNGNVIQKHPFEKTETRLVIFTSLFVKTAVIHMMLMVPFLWLPNVPDSSLVLRWEKRSRLAVSNQSSNILIFAMWKKYFA